MNMLNSVTIEGLVLSKPVLTTTRNDKRFYSVTIDSRSEYKEQEYHTIITVSVWKEELHSLCESLKEDDHITVFGKIKTNQEGKFPNVVVRDIIMGSKPDAEQRVPQKSKFNQYLKDADEQCKKDLATNEFLHSKATLKADMDKSRSDVVAAGENYLRKHPLVTDSGIGEPPNATPASDIPF